VSFYFPPDLIPGALPGAQHAYLPSIDQAWRFRGSPAHITLAYFPGIGQFGPEMFGPLRGKKKMLLVPAGEVLERTQLTRETLDVEVYTPTATGHGAAVLALILPRNGGRASAAALREKYAHETTVFEQMVASLDWSGAGTPHLTAVPLSGKCE